MDTKPVLTESPKQAEKTIDTAEDVFLLLAAEAAGLAESHLWRIDLDRGNRVLGRELIADRGADTLVVHPRRVFRGALAAGAAKVVIAHNHPSQNLARTDADHILTGLMVMAGCSLGIPLHDHVILTDKAFFSFRDAGHLK
jgi:DNA repair protein RadC